MSKLPPKWKLKVTKENIDEVGKWRDSGYSIELLNGWIVSLHSTGKWRGHYYRDGERELLDYTEISTGTFFNQVLNKKEVIYEVC